MNGAHELIRIKNIYLTKVKKDDYFIVEEKNNQHIILNLTKGLDESNQKITLTNKLNYIYQEGKEYQEKVYLWNIEKVSLKTNIEILNRSNKKVVSSPCIIEVIDRLGSYFYIDVLKNTTYTRRNHYILKLFSNSKERVLYQRGVGNKIWKTKLIIRSLKMFSPLFEIDEEDLA